MKKNLTFIIFFLILSGIALFLLGPNSSTVLAIEGVCPYGRSCGYVVRNAICGNSAGSPLNDTLQLLVRYTAAPGTTCYSQGCLTSWATTNASGWFDVPSVYNGNINPNVTPQIGGKPYSSTCNQTLVDHGIVYVSVIPAITGGGSTITTPTTTPTTTYPDLFVDSLSPANGSVFYTSSNIASVPFSGIVNNIAQLPSCPPSCSVIPPIAGPSQALLFINYNLDNTLDFPLNFSLSWLYQTPDINMPPYFRPVPQTPLLQLGPGGTSRVSWSIYDAPPGIHGFAICANMHVNQSTGLRDVPVETNFNNNCTFGWFIVAQTPTSFNMRSSTTSCSGTQSYVDTSWTPSANTSFYNLYRFVDNGQVEPAITLYLSQLSPQPYYDGVNPYYFDGTNFHYRDTNNIQGGHTYNYEVLAYNSTYGTYAWANYTTANYPTTPSVDTFASITAASCNPPTITSLEITNTGNTSFGGARATSGRQSSQQGSDWNNPIEVKLNAQKGSADIKEYYVNFGSEFELEYISGVPYVKYGQNLQDLRGFPLGYEIPNLVSVAPAGSSNTPAAWTVRFDQNFGDKSMATGARVVDQNNLEDSDSNCTENKSQPDCPLIIH